MEENKSNKKILMFPWLAFGHISPYIELAKKLSQNNTFQIWICSTPIILQTIQSKLPKSPSNPIQLVELNLPSLPDLPPELHSTTALPNRLKSALHKAFDSTAPQFHSILLKLNPHSLITELFQPWAIRSASSLNIPVVSFLPPGAGALIRPFHYFVNSAADFPFPELDLRHHWSSRKFENVAEDSSLADSMKRFVEWMECLDLCCDVVLVNSFREMEGKYIDCLSVLMKKKIVPVGPLVRDVDDKLPDPISEWLDKKESRSTVYVSFGSEYHLSKMEMEEVGMGLEMSGANFIWVVRFPKGEEMGIKEALPDGFMDRVGDRGIVVHGWVPQPKILSHFSVGGFVSHCGWNSVVEAVVNGVPIIAMPMRVDQPCNMKVAVAVGVAVEVARGVHGAVERQGVANAVKHVLFGKTGEDFNARAKEISEGLKVQQGGNIDRCVFELNKLCE